MTPDFVPPCGAPAVCRRCRDLGIELGRDKTLVHSVSPLWTTTIRSAIATVALLAFLIVRGSRQRRARATFRFILGIALLHMVAFSALVAFGLQFVPVGRSIVLGYTTLLWVAPAAWLLLGEAMTRARLAGIGLGLAGLVVMFNPLALDWSDTRALLGNGLILLAALCWAVNILYVRVRTDGSRRRFNWPSGRPCSPRSFCSCWLCRSMACRTSTGLRVSRAHSSMAVSAARRWPIGRWRW